MCGPRRGRSGRANLVSQFPRSPRSKSMSDGENFPNCFGPYLRYAIRKDFDVVSFAKNSRLLLLLVEFRNGYSATSFASELRRVRKKDNTEIEFSPQEAGFHHVTLIADRAVVVPSRQDRDTVADWISAWETQAFRVELSLPLMTTSSLGLDKEASK